MTFKQLKSLSFEDQQKKIAESKVELLKLNGQVATGTAPKSPGRIRQLKKIIAHILTAQNEQKEEEISKQNG